MTRDRAKLAEFVDATEKVAPPVFVGRDAVLADILKAARRSWDGSGAGVHGQAGATRILQGAPGAGKSALLAELVRRTAAGGSDGAPISVLTLSSGRIRGPLDILAPLAERVDPATARDFLARVQTTQSRGGAVGAFGSALTGAHTTTTMPHHPEPSMVAFHEWVRDPNSKATLTGPLIVAIDEAQNMRYGDDDPRTSVLRCIHDADPPLPLTLVLAGLGDTQDRAAALGLTRGLTLHAIGALPDDAVTALTARWCAHFGLDLTGSEARLAALAAPCEGWPRHLHVALQALGRHVLATEGTLDAVDWTRVATAAAVSRLHYYQGQQSLPLKECAPLVGAVLHDLESAPRSTAPSRSHLIDWIDRHAGIQPGRAWQIPRGMDADTLADTLLHQGALQLTQDKTLAAAIPSFVSYLVRDGRRMALAGVDRPAVAKDPDSRAAARLLSAAVPHTEAEIIHWHALAATWHRHCATLAAVATDAAALAPVTDVPTAPDRARATAVLATLDALGGAPAADPPALPHTLPHAVCAVAALEGMVDAVRAAAQAIRDGTDDPFRAKTLGAVMMLPDQAAAATPAQQLAWAIEHLTGVPPPSPDTPAADRTRLGCTTN